MQDEIEISLTEIAAILISKLWLILLCAVIFAGGAFTVTKYVIDEKYTASVSMYVQAGSSNENLIASINELNYAQKVVNTYIQILKTDVFLKEVSRTIDLPYGPEELLEMIEMEAVENTEIFEVRVTTKDPRESLLLARTIAELAPQKIIEIKNADDVKVVDPATLPKEPSSPDIIKNTAIGLALGLMLGMMIAFLIHFLDKRVKDEEDIIRYHNIPVLGIVPVIEE